MTNPHPMDDTTGFAEPQSLEARLDAIKHVRVNLSGDVENPCKISPHRPEISLWAGFEFDTIGAHVVFHVRPLWGQPSRFAELTPAEARRLAQILNAMADAIDREVAS